MSVGVTGVLALLVPLGATIVSSSLQNRLSMRLKEIIITILSPAQKLYIYIYIL